MSFSSEVKEELSKMGNLANKNCVKKELIGYLISKNTTTTKNKIEFSTESEYNINRFAKLINNIDVQDYKIELKGKKYIIKLKIDYLKDIITLEENKIIKIKDIELKNDEESKAITRGAFLGAGYISSIDRKNHLEIAFLNIENAEYIIKLLEKYNISTKLLKKENEFSIYIKDGEEISKFLAFIGANKAVLNFEEVRVQKEMNNKINRIVNCETSNLNKTINASVEQINAIKYLQKTKKFELLNDKLKEIAIVRLENPNMNLGELGKLLKEPVGKSGVNYRLKKIIEIADKNKI